MITPLFDPQGPSEVGAALVRFEPGARTAWHKHPLGQRLVVVEGSGWTQVEGGPVEAIRAGDVIWCPPGLSHWHGATPTTAMAHIAIQESQNGSPVTWMEHVADEAYLKGPK
jgi:quercetin dioxygenase-like cupin family protein